MARIELQNISLTFKLRNGRTSLKELLLQKKFNPHNQIRVVQALSNVNLAVQHGDRVGVIGHNGAGKSTLLRVLAGIYAPTTGTRTVEGRISSLFDIALGFEMDSSGWENISYRGYLQGETPRTIARKIDEIAAFSELGNFLGMPVRYYSSGMLVRLAFSIATAIEPEILLIDEALGAGDMAFQVKARKRILDVIAKAQMMVMVSHDLGNLAKMCDRGVWMDHGEVKLSGSIKEVIQAYTQHTNIAKTPAA